MIRLFPQLPCLFPLVIADGDTDNASIVTGPGERQTALDSPQLHYARAMGTSPAAPERHRRGGDLHPAPGYGQPHPEFHLVRSVGER